MYNEKKILITISGYYERFQIDTVKSCIKRAAYPDRLSFALAYHDDHKIDLSGISNKVKTYIIPKGERVGIQPAKNRLFSMLEGEDFILSIDSHVVMMPDWDKELLADYYEKVAIADNKKIIISGNFGNTINVGEMEYEYAVDNYFNSESFFTEKLANPSVEYFDYGYLFQPQSSQDYQGTVLSYLPYLTYNKSGYLPSDVPSNIYSGNFSMFPKEWVESGNNFSKEIFFSGDQPETSINIFSSGYDIWAPKFKYHCHMRDHVQDQRLQRFRLGSFDFCANEYLDIEKDLFGITWFLNVIKNGYPGEKRARSLEEFFNYFNLNKKEYDKDIPQILLEKYKNLFML
jgi:hypothetical protein